MKTTKTLRTAACAALIMTIGCAGLMAQPKPENNGFEEPDPAIKLPYEDELPKELPPKENEELCSITGKIGTFTKDGQKFITITSVSSKKTYILNADSSARDTYRKIPGNIGFFNAENDVTADYFLDNVGKKVTLTGILNKEFGVFSVIKSGTIPRPQPQLPIRPVYDAK